MWEIISWIKKKKKNRKRKEKWTNREGTIEKKCVSYVASWSRCSTIFRSSREKYRSSKNDHVSSMMRRRFATEDVRSNVRISPVENLNNHENWRNYYKIRRIITRFIKRIEDREGKKKNISRGFFLNRTKVESIFFGKVLRVYFFIFFFFFLF